MKRLITLLTAIVMLLSFAACNTSNPQASPTPDATKSPLEGTPNTEILNEILETVLEGTDDQINAPVSEVDPEMFSYYLFTDGVEGSVAIVSEPMINAIAHSLVLLMVPDGTDVESLAANIKENADPRKWICVEAEKTEVVYSKNVIMLVMSAEDFVDTVVSNFETNYK